MNTFIKKFIDKDRAPHIVVVGDAMLDEYVSCEILGISPEDEMTFKVREGVRRVAPGGAANVAMNLAALGCDVDFCFVAGRDEGAASLAMHLVDYRVKTSMVYDDKRPTTRKTRYVTSKGKHLIRIDTELSLPVSGVPEDNLIKNVCAAQADLIIVSDYNKGTITERLIRAIEGSGIPYIVDPKGHCFDFYGKAYVVTPNEREFREAFKLTRDEPLKMAAGHIQIPHGQLVLITRAGQGAQLWATPEVGTMCMEDFPVRERRMGDPAGCGDSLLAGLAYGLALKWPLRDACQLAVAAGSCAVDHFGVYPVKHEDVVAELKALYGETYAN